MKPRIKYSDEPMGTLKPVRDFLPPPDKLVLKEDRVKVTISLSKNSVDFFETRARHCPPASHLLSEDDPARH